MNKTLWISLLVLGSFGTALAESAPQSPFSLYRGVVDVLEASRAFSVHVEKQFDVVLLDGAKVEYSGALDLLVEREGAMHLEYGDDLSARQAWYDGSTVTLLDPLTNVYAQVPAQGRVGDMLANLNQRFGLEMPLVPLLRREVAGDFEAHVESATYLGLHDVAGEACHHVLYRGANVDLQAWITTGDEPLIRKLVATFWQIEGAPQQSLVFTNWNLEASTSPADFEPDIPENAVRTEFLPLEERSP